MRTIAFLLFTGVMLTASAQNNNGPCPAYQDLNTTYASAAAWSYKAQETVYHYNEWSIGADGRPRRSRAYQNGRRNRNTGIGLLIGGAVSLTGGIAMLTDGIISIKRRNIYSTTSGLSEVGHLYEAYFGAIFTAAGLGMIVPGAILLPKGTRQMRRAQERMANP